MAVDFSAFDQKVDLDALQRMLYVQNIIVVNKNSE